MKIDHPIFNSLDPELIKTVYGLVNSIKVNNALLNEVTISDDSVRNIQKVLEALEFSIIDYWQFSLDNKPEHIEERKLFNQMCLDYFKLLQIIKIPDAPIQKIKMVLKLITFAYLGEKWEDMRRYLLENETKLIVECDSVLEWDQRLFSKIYMAIFYLIRKNRWEDLSKSSKLITELRSEQTEFEKKYLDSKDVHFKAGSTLELASLYHLAKCTEVVSEYMLNGTPQDALEQIDFHFEKAILLSQNARIIELDLILRMLSKTFKKMIFNSIWYITKTVNSRVTKYVNLITRSNKPIFELLYPQRLAVVEKGLLDPASKAIIVNLPTSSGKTVIAEFRILQALNQFSDDKGWIVYVAPTKALVNQITSRLRKDLSISPLSIRVEKMSGALELDSFEENIINQSSFDILVTTPEKISLLIRQGIETKLKRPLVLAIIDEAHNLADSIRGLNLELLLSIIKKDCSKANLLLLTPFIPNSKDIVEWLDPQNPKSISIELNWQPSDKVIGMFYPKENNGLGIEYKPLITNHDTIIFDKPVKLNKEPIQDYTLTKLKTKYILTANATNFILSAGNALVIAKTVPDTWKLAEELFALMPDVPETSEDIELVKKYVSAELGQTFPLVKLLSKRIGVHNAGLPDEVKSLMESLMEDNQLKVLVATTTIAQGINFPVSLILMTSYSYPYRNMPYSDFWNLAGRAGRINQRSLGVVGIAVKEDTGDDAIKAIAYVKNSTEDLVSVLVEMVNQAISTGNDLDLSSLAHQPEWSMFLQYISHMYKQSQNLQNFIADIEMTLKRTYGFNKLDNSKKRILIEAAKKYAEKLDSNKHLATLSDLTGFSPETIDRTIAKVSELGIKQSDWNSSELFSNSTDTLQKLMGIMLNIPEVKKGLNIKVSGTVITNSSLARIITDWVSGRELIEISREYFGGIDTPEMTKCIHAIYSKITNCATWGLSAMQKLPTVGIKFSELSESERNKINNIPAMIYYGVNTDEAILMRMNNLPRKISNRFGLAYKQEFEDIYKKTPSEVSGWLKSLSSEDWNSIVQSEGTITGKDYQKIWKKLSGD